MSYTKGPWKHRIAVNYEGFSIHPVNTVLSLASCERYGENIAINCFNFPGETEDNARLIATAPELVEALELMFDSYVLCTNSSQETPEMKRARTIAGMVLNKVKGVE